MVSIEVFSRLVAQIYASATGGQDWQVTLGEIGSVLHADGVGIICSECGDRSLRSTILGPVPQQAYAEHFRHLDYVLSTVEAGPVGLIHGGADLVATRTNPEFYFDWLRPHRLDDGLFVRLTAGPDSTSFLIAGPHTATGFGTPENIALVSALTPHLQQALACERSLYDFAAAAGDTALVMDAFTHACVLIGANSTVVQLNNLASQILDNRDGVCLRGGALTAESPSDARRLTDAIAGALHGPHFGLRNGDSLVCRRPSGKRPYVIHVLPAQPSEEHRAPRALVVIIDPERRPEPAAELLCRLYRLTRAEADIAVRITRGSELKDIADALSVSLATVKTHLQHIFDKTDTHRQAELMRLLLTVTP